MPIDFMRVFDAACEIDPPDEPLRRWHIDATVRIPDIEPDQLCTATQAEQWARDMIARLLCELDDYEVMSLSMREVEEDD